MLLACFFTRAKAQYFERVYGDEMRTHGAYFAINTDHEIIAGGTFYDTTFFTRGYYLLKIDTNGGEIWHRGIADFYNRDCASVTTLTDGRIVLLGTHSGVFYQGLAEVKVLDPAGNVVRSTDYPPVDGWGTSGTALCSTGDSSVLITFYTDGFISTNFYSVYRLLPDLSTEWSDFVSFDGSLTDKNGLASSGVSNVYTIAYYDLYYYSGNLLFGVTNVRKHDPAGLLLSDSLYDFNCIATAVTALHDEGAAIAGTDDTTGRMELILARLDSAGNLLYRKNYSGTQDAEANDIVQTADSGFIILSTVTDSVVPGQHDIMILKTDINGDSLWSRQFGGPLDEKGIHIEKDGGDLVIMAETNSFAEDRIYIIRTDSLGNIPCPYSIQAGGRYFCAPDTATLYLIPPPRPGVHIAWSNGDTVNPARVNSSGNYFAVLTDSFGNSIRTPSVPVYFADYPDADFGTDTMALCSGTQLLAAGNPELTNHYQWYLDGSPLPGDTLSTLVPLLSGNYKLVVSNYCGTDSSTSLIDTLYDLPDLPVITSPPVVYVCPGDSLRLSVAGQLNTVFQWYTTDHINNYPLAGATDSILYAYQGGLYLVSATNSNGCSVFSQTYTVLYNNGGEYINPNGPATFCQGGQVELSVSPGSQYHWSNGDTTQSILVRAGGHYSVSFINQYGCPKNSDTLTITVLNNPVVDLGEDTIVCLETSITLDAGAGFNNYYWNDGSTGRTLDVLVHGTVSDTNSYFVSVTDTNGCTNGDTLTLIFDLCTFIGISESGSFSLFPNPSDYGRSFEINWVRFRKLRIEVSDLTGRKLSSFHAFPGQMITNTFLPDRGIYFFRISDDLGTSRTGKIIIK